MRRESDTTLRHDGRVLRGRASLETEALVFRGEVLVAVQRTEIRKVEASGDWLDVHTARGLFMFELGANARAWAAEIEHPGALAKTLGVGPKTKVIVFGPLDAGLRAELVTAGADVAKTSRGSNKDVAFVAVKKSQDLERLAAARASLGERGVIWVVYPPGRDDPRDRDVLVAGRTLQLTDGKPIEVDDDLAAVRFTPLVRRARK